MTAGRPAFEVSSLMVEPNLKEKDPGQVVRKVWVEFPGLLHRVGMSPQKSQNFRIKLEADTCPPAGARSERMAAHAECAPEGNLFVWVHDRSPSRSATRIVSRPIPSGALFAPTVVMARCMISPWARIQEAQCSSQSGCSRARVTCARPGGPEGSISALAVRTPCCTAIAASQALTWGKGALARRRRTRRSPSALLSSR